MRQHEPPRAARSSTDLRPQGSAELVHPPVQQRGAERGSLAPSGRDANDAPLVETGVGWAVTPRRLGVRPRIRIGSQCYGPHAVVGKGGKTSGRR